MMPIRSLSPSVIDQATDGNGIVWLIGRTTVTPSQVELPASLFMLDLTKDPPSYEPLKERAGSSARITEPRSLTVTVGGALGVVDQSGKRLMYKKDATTPWVVEYSTKHDIGDVESDEFGNLYFSVGQSILQLDRFGNISPVWTGAVQGSDPMSAAVSIKDPRAITIGPSGDLFVVNTGGERISVIRKVSGLWVAPSRIGSWRNWGGDASVRLGAERYCICDGGSPEGTSFVKAKISIENRHGNSSLAVSSESIYLLVMYEGSPRLSYGIQQPGGKSDSQISEGWSGRTLFSTPPNDIVHPEPLETVTVTGVEYSVYALPANPNNSVYSPTEGMVGFATSLDSINVAPGSTYFDKRPSYSSAVFYVPKKGADGEALNVIPIGLGLWDGSSGKWVTMTSVNE